MENTKKILIVDDDSDWADSISLFLENVLGIKPVKKHSALEALDALDTQSIDIVITDTNMPGTNGIELLGVIKAFHPTVKVIVFFDQLFGSELQKPDVLRMGASAVIKKEDAQSLLPDVLKRV